MTVMMCAAAAGSGRKCPEATGSGTYEVAGVDFGVSQRRRRRNVTVSPPSPFPPPLLLLPHPLTQPPIRRQLTGTRRIPASSVTGRCVRNALDGINDPAPIRRYENGNAASLSLFFFFFFFFLSSFLSFFIIRTCSPAYPRSIR